MITKLDAARVASRRAIPTLIVYGKRPDGLARALAGDAVGTLFRPSSSRQRGRKAWIESLRVRGRIVCDAGAVDALRHHGKSLLPSGIVRVEARFDEGDAVALCDETGEEFARGLTTYPSTDVRRIAGLQSSGIEGVLGYHVSDVVVHRDDLVLTDTTPASSTSEEAT